MLAPLSWLCDYAPFGDLPVEHLSAALSDLGLVVEGTTHVGADLPGVVVARILDIRAHPDADRIRLVDVDPGDGGPLQIACGAWNMATGDLVPLARDGAVLPDGTVIRSRRMRGQMSNGMLCSPTEIGQPEVEGVDGLLILPPGLAEPGTPIAAALGGPDVVWDLDVSPNRPDALCMAGISRDLAGALGLAWSWPAALPGGGPGEGAVDGAAGPVTGTAVTDPGVPRPQVVVDDADLCPRFTAAVLTGVRVGTSPPWLTRRLALAGMRSINTVVDVSNYVMLDVGQPNHAYDLDQLGGRGLEVRRSRAGETLVTLDGVTRTFDGDDLLICDAAATPVGVAGIMGGESSEISASTTSVLLEAAWFDPFAIARTGTRLGLTSEARHRFERGVDTEIASRAVARFAQLLAAVTTVPAGAEPLRCGPTVDVRSDADLPDPAVVEVRTARVNTLLGTDLDDGVVVKLLTSIGFGVEASGPGRHTVTVPTWRPDTEREVDVVEEVARLHGYRNIPRRVPRPPGGGGLTPFQSWRRRVRAVLNGAGLDEAWTTTFLAPGDLERAGLDAAAVTVTNPLDRSESILRTSLLPGLLKAVRFNADRQQPDVRFFETGRVFARPSGDGVVPAEREDLAVVTAGVGAGAPLSVRLWTVLAHALAPVGVGLEAAVVPGLHPTRTARILAGDGTTLGEVGEVDPDVVAAYGLTGRVGWLRVDMEALAAQPTPTLLARSVRRFPASDVDLAFVVDDAVPAAAVGATLRSAAGDLLEDLHLFDVYRGERLGAGRRSLAWRLRLRPAERTLTEADLAAARQAAIDAVVAAHAAELRA